MHVVAAFTAPAAEGFGVRGGGCFDCLRRPGRGGDRAGACKHAVQCWVEKRGMFALEPFSKDESWNMEQVDSFVPQSRRAYLLLYWYSGSRESWLLEASLPGCLASGLVVSSVVRVCRSTFPKRTRLFQGPPSSERRSRTSVCLLVAILHTYLCTDIRRFSLVLTFFVLFFVAPDFQVRRGVVPPCPESYTRKVYGSGPRFMNQDDDSDSEPELIIPSRGNRERSPVVRSICTVQLPWRGGRGREPRVGVGSAAPRPTKLHGHETELGRGRMRPVV